MANSELFPERKSVERLAFEYWLRTGQHLTTPAEFMEAERKFNPNHDSQNGQFAFGPGGRASSASTASMTSRPANNGKDYPARIDLRNGARPYPVRIALPRATSQSNDKQDIENPPAPAIRFHHRPGLDLSEPVIAKANTLSDSVRSATGYRIVVTSGRRNESRQASAMYNNYAEGHPPGYANQAAEHEIHQAYGRGQKAGKSRGQIISEMTDVLRGQARRGIFISRHMLSGAIDIHTPPVHVLRAIRNHPSVQSVGVENDHIHIQFR